MDSPLIEEKSKDQENSVQLFSDGFLDALRSPIKGIAQLTGQESLPSILIGGSSHAASSRSGFHTAGDLMGQAVVFSTLISVLKIVPRYPLATPVSAGAALGFIEPVDNNKISRRLCNGFLGAATVLALDRVPLFKTDISSDAAEEWTRSAIANEASSPSFDLAKEYWHTNEQQTVDGLKDFLRIPSVSSLPEHAEDMQRAAASISEQLNRMGMQKVVVHQGQAGEHPLVTAEWMGAPNKPTLLFYAHYDVQPVDPVGAWSSPPFEPTERDGKLFARGAADDKGHLYMLMRTLDGYLSTSQKLPVNVKLIFEGEEESSGSHIDRFVRHNKDAINADASVVLDEGMFAPGLPTIQTGLRGIVRAKVKVTGADHDLHSGEHGGAAPNAAQALSQMIASLHTREGKARIPKFYDDVIPPGKAELDSWKSLPFDEEEYRKSSLGAPGLIGDTKYSVLQRLWALPTVEVNGIEGGYAGTEGFKTVIPSQASANFSMRLAPGMDPDKTGALFAKYITSVAPPHVKTEITVFPGSRGMVVDPNNAFVQSAADAFTSTFGKRTVFVRDGASIPIAETLQSTLNKPVLITGVTHPDAHLHAPDENLNIANFHAGIEALGRYMENIGQLERR